VPAATDGKVTPGFVTAGLEDFHAAKVIARDPQGQATTKSWSFTVT